MSKVYPNLFIIGAMKSGTTSLHEYLNLHPDIYMSDMKEPGYFVDGVNNIPDNPEAYLDLFVKGEGKKIVGESSTHYTKLPTLKNAPERIKVFCDEVNINPKFIYLMRDPIKRAISHYWHDVRKEGQYLSILDALKRTDRNEYIDFSDYAMQLSPYFEIFGKENVLVLTFEEMISNTENTLRQIFGWLGVDEMIELPKDIGAHNTMPAQFNKVRGRGLLHKMRNHPLWNAISPLVPKTFKKKAISMSVKQVTVDASHDESIRTYLKPIFLEKILPLEQMLGRKFPEWGSLRSD